MTTLSAAEKKQLRAIAHNLNPIIIVGDKGVSEGLLEELDRALEQHELIKVKVASNDREFRAQAMTEMAEKTNATQVQIIGKIVVLLRRSKKPNPKLSNLIRM
ncbi:RNA-binding protein [Oleiphilus sp. HI0009]|jgi:RNA-binding protein|uniref:ribosome assembly RNA-binding protein YhbY n=3 Tax=Oleiphilus TaxID=141450 RepID=UPI0007C22BB5|nr:MULTISPECIES: ribosome assembly RNA-binding protein YhbY [unclassified Oleiphilus]KZX80531.1 RNA-binding protein [Oleiphilus sp. HI0009]MCH2157303.1 ribosome assembly RNA-binding protein YhbY [Oleiphilaceae bacterium]KZY67104.1 RNA-binding protein [Oleiphilus sp. HI0066]KZY73921.1 RNA-binding protein [Oleiphilus sp. HI0067]KZZ55403.1 RNA-binding protein [Oleiphilus sp. HI0125]